MKDLWGAQSYPGMAYSSTASIASAMSDAPSQNQSSQDMKYFPSHHIIYHFSDLHHLFFFSIALWKLLGEMSGLEWGFWMWPLMLQSTPVRPPPSWSAGRNSQAASLHFIARDPLLSSYCIAGHAAVTAMKRLLWWWTSCCTGVSGSILVQPGDKNGQ